MKKNKIEFIIKAFSFLLFIYLLYKSEIYWKGDQRSFYYKYYE